eukprot:g23169.t1
MIECDTVSAALASELTPAGADSNATVHGLRLSRITGRHDSSLNTLNQIRQVCRQSVHGLNHRLCRTAASGGG